MKTLKILGWILFAGSVSHYFAGILSGEFFLNIGGLLYYGTSMKSFWLSVMSALCLLLSIIVMFIVLFVQKRSSKKHKTDL